MPDLCSPVRVLLLACVLPLNAQTVTHRSLDFGNSTTGSSGRLASLATVDGTDGIPKWTMDFLRGEPAFRTSSNEKKLVTYFKSRILVG